MTQTGGETKRREGAFCGGHCFDLCRKSNSSIYPRKAISAMMQMRVESSMVAMMCSFLPLSSDFFLCVMLE